MITKQVNDTNGSNQVKFFKFIIKSFLLKKNLSNYKKKYKFHEDLNPWKLKMISDIL